MSFSWDFPVDFDCFFEGFSPIFQWIFRVEKEKVAAILCTRLRENHNIYKKKMMVLPSTRPAVEQGSHKGASPLDPHHPLQTDVLEKENPMFGLTCNFIIIPGEGK